jgi:hypothetical protein
MICRKLEHKGNNFLISIMGRERYFYSLNRGYLLPPAMEVKYEFGIHYVWTAMLVMKDNWSNLYFPIEICLLNDEFLKNTDKIKMINNLAIVNENHENLFTKLWIPLCLEDITPYYEEHLKGKNTSEGREEGEDKLFSCPEYIEHCIQNDIVSVTKQFEKLSALYNHRESSIDVDSIKYIDTTFGYDIERSKWNIKFGKNKQYGKKAKKKFTIDISDLFSDANKINDDVRKYNELCEKGLWGWADKFKYYICIDDNDDISYTRYFNTEEEMKEEIRYLHICQPIDIDLDLSARGYAFTN